MTPPPLLPLHAPSSVPSFATEPLHVTVTADHAGDWTAKVVSGKFRNYTGHGLHMEEALDDLLFTLKDEHGLVWRKADRVCIKLS